MALEDFDTLEYVEELAEAGVDEKHAKVHAHYLKKLIDNKLATKTDILDVKRDIEVVKSELKKDIEIVKSDLKKDMAELGERLTIRLVIVGGIQVGIISLIMGIFKFLMP